MDKKKAPKVVIIYYALLHYRQSLFDYLLESDEVNFHIICGQKSQFANSKYYQPKHPNISVIKNRFFNLSGKLFYIQTPVIRTILQQKPEVLILRGVNPQIISMLYTFIFIKLFKRNIKIYWWGHGGSGNQGGLGVLFRKFFYKYSNGVLLQGNEGVKTMKAMEVEPQNIYVVGNLSLIHI